GGRRHPVPLRHLLPFAGAEADRGRADRRTERGQDLERAHRDRGGAVTNLLPGRGLSPGVFPAEPVPAVLPGRRLPAGGEVPQTICGETQVLSRDERTCPSRGGSAPGTGLVMASTAQDLQVSA